ncbi:DUF1311 domain-containing protein [Pasteurella atlantica]|uniref:DUF1311 domain-containing protein n=2 Tax=Pasteurellaceae TaxID=712 RepID=A0ACC6HNY3_9PAST|nr:lysozyme inhibitor LprI family protein [Pasteurella atlantica]MDP8033326.1 DUF1311 domain-containing protein [Pasteurella atlantica]MDP8035262.1 DUF1311 domain-containing protein [Pasteurella atlantica]MDP8037213.1 DUF1311 domain-containing protein [Pasteurella atlantica]MDP8047674.1 DUF1311 domain-containing protein [Pasteurella atlantica]MDP8049515.1 DUF1311 domain-containing protein [Pasteurella atlantica]
MSAKKSAKGELIKKFVFIIFCFSGICFAQTQTEMNQLAYAEFQKSDKKLNEVYQAILSEYKTASLFIEKLKKSQRLWVKFRDAELEMKYPVSENANPRVMYVSNIECNILKRINR